MAMVMFVVWFYRARVNAEGHGWPQRWSPGWAIAGWLVPVVNFWFPFQIMADIWRATRGLILAEKVSKVSELTAVTVSVSNH